MITEAWAKIQDKIVGLIAAFPDIAVALIVFGTALIVFLVSPVRQIADSTGSQI